MNGDALNIWFSESMSNVGVASTSPQGCDLSDVTVIIPSYKRQAFILRQFVYWSASSAEVLVMDGSPEPLSEKCQEILNGFPKLCYLHSPTSFCERLRLASQSIRTAYSIMLADDEFHLFEGLYAALSRLQTANATSADTVGCIGQSLRFNFDVGINGITIGQGYPHENFEVVGRNIKDRLNFAMDDYTPATSYALLTSSCWSETWGSLESWSCPYATELQQALMTYICGKLVSVDKVYWMRSMELEPVNIKGEFDRNVCFIDWWTERRYRAEKNKFIKILTQFLMAKEGSSYGAASSKINEAIEIYIAISIPTTSKFSRNIKFKLQYLINATFGQSVYELARKIYKVFTGGTYQAPPRFYPSVEYFARIDGQSVQKSECFTSELSNIEDLVTHFYQSY